MGCHALSFIPSLICVVVAGVGLRMIPWLLSHSSRMWAMTAGRWDGGGEKREHFPICDPTSCLWRHSWDSSLGLQLLHMGLQLPTGWQVLDQGRAPSSLLAGSGSILLNSCLGRLLLPELGYPIPLFDTLSLNSQSGFSLPGSVLAGSPEEVLGCTGTWT